MAKLKEINGYVRLTLDKLQGIRADLVRKDNGWHEWKFPQLAEALESWARWNPITLKENKIQKSFKANQFKVEYVYCNQSDHKPADCEKVKSVSDRRKILSEKKLCFNVTGGSTVPLTAVATKSAYYTNVNTTPQFERNVLMKFLSQCSRFSIECNFSGGQNKS